MDFKSFYEKPQLFGWVTQEIFSDPDFADDGDVRIEDILDAPDIYRAYPWMRQNVVVKLVHINNSALNGEGIRIMTLGGGEGTIFIAKEMWDDALDKKDLSTREFLAKALVHELGHALQDHDDDDYSYKSSDEIQDAEKFANDFMNKWYR